MVWFSSFIAAMPLTLLSVVVRTADRQGLPRQLALFKAIAIALATNSILHTAQSPLEQASARYAQSGLSLLSQLELDSCRGYLTIKERARLNSISYLLSLAPCEDQTPRKPVKLPKRSNEIATLGRADGYTVAVSNTGLRTEGGFR
jgi:hypothetical protein